MVIDPEERELGALLARLPSATAMRVVEIGCGEGRLTRRYSHHVSAILAIDPDAAAVAAFRRNGVPANVDLRETATEHLDVPDASVDVVLFSWAL